jgi:hypothetical protein
MVDSLGEIAAVLDWQDAYDVREAVNDTLLALGVASVDTVTDRAALRAVARFHAWRLAVSSLVAFYDFTNPEGSYHRSQMLAAARAALLDAEREASVYVDTSMTVRVSRLERHDPYRPAPDEEWGA